MWQLFFTLPNWDAQIASPFKRSGSSFLSAAGLLAASGVTFIWHYFNLSALFKTDGAVAVGLVNAVRQVIFGQQLRFIVACSGVDCPPADQALGMPGRGRPSMQLCRDLRCNARALHILVSGAQLSPCWRGGCTAARSGLVSATASGRSQALWS